VGRYHSGQPPTPASSAESAGCGCGLGGLRLLGVALQAVPQWRSAAHISGEMDPSARHAFSSS
jgi:hypothetical protein